MNVEFRIQKSEFLRAFHIPHSTFLMALLVCVAAMPAGAQQTFSGRLSDSICGASHQSKSSSAALSDRSCIFSCLNAPATSLLVD